MVGSGGNPRWTTVGDICRNHKLAGHTVDGERWRDLINSKLESIADALYLRQLGSADHIRECRARVREAVLGDQKIGPHLNQELIRDTVNALDRLLQSLLHQRKLNRTRPSAGERDSGLIPPQRKQHLKRKRPPTGEEDSDTKPQKKRESTPTPLPRELSIRPKTPMPQPTLHIPVQKENKHVHVVLTSQPNEDDQRDLYKSGFLNLANVIMKPTIEELTEALTKKYPDFPIRSAGLGATTYPTRDDMMAKRSASALKFDLDTDEDLQGFIGFSRDLEVDRFELNVTLPRPAATRPSSAPLSNPQATAARVKEEDNMYQSPTPLPGGEERHDASHVGPPVQLQTAPPMKSAASFQPNIDEVGSDEPASQSGSNGGTASTYETPDGKETPQTASRDEHDMADEQQDGSSPNADDQKAAQSDSHAVSSSNAKPEDDQIADLQGDNTDQGVDVLKPAQSPNLYVNQEQTAQDEVSQVAVVSPVTEETSSVEQKEPVFKIDFKTIRTGRKSGPGGDDDDDDDDDKYASHHYIPGASDVSPEDVAEFQRVFYIQGGPGWDPTKGIKTPIIAGITGYQALVVWWMIIRETEDKVGGVVALEPGLGKTRICIMLWTLNHVMNTIRSKVEDEWNDTCDAVSERQHLPEDCSDLTAECPSGYAKENAGIRCFCEPGMKTFYSFCTTTPSIVLAAHRLLNTAWATEFEKALGEHEQDHIEKLTGLRMIATVGHHTAPTPAKRPRITSLAQALKSICAPGLTEWDWEDKNPNMSYNDILWATHKAPDKVVVPENPPQPYGAHVLIISTPGSVYKHVMEPSTKVTRPAADFSMKCDGAGKCKLAVPKQCKSHNWKFNAEKKHCLAIGRWYMDECHLHKNIETGMVIEFTRHTKHAAHLQKGFAPRLWAITGTPFPDAATDLLPVFASQETSAWATHPILKNLTMVEAKRAVTIESTHRAYTLCEVPTKTERDSVDHIYGLYHPNQRPLGDHKATTQHLFEHDMKPKVVAWNARYIVRLTASSRINGYPILVLPDLSSEEKVFSIKDPAVSAELLVLGTEYSNGCARLEKLEKLREMIQQGKVAKTVEVDISREREHVRNATRLLRMSIDMPYVRDIFKTEPDLLLGRNILGNGWWLHPEKSKLWNNWEALLASSPKLQYIVKEARARKRMTTAVSIGDNKVTDVDHYDKIIFAALEPGLCFCIYVVLLRSLEERYGCLEKAKEAIQPMWRGGKTDDIINRFQLVPVKENACSGPSVDIIILPARVGATGITLTRANRLVMADVDQSASRDTQLSRRHHRIGQKRTTTFVQLVSECFDLEPVILRLRKQGISLTNGIVTMKKIGEVEDDNARELTAVDGHQGRPIVVDDA